MRVLATYSIKGGVGKTTAAVNLGDEAARSGARVLLWDLDPQGAATFFVRVKPVLKGGAERLVSRRGELGDHVRATDVPGMHVLPADFSLRHLDLHLDDTAPGRLADLLAPLAGDYDVALLDCPPGITLTSEGVFGAADALLVPTIPSTLSARTLDQLTTFLASVDPAPALLPFISMIDRRRTVHREVAADAGGSAGRHARHPDPQRRRRRADGRRTRSAGQLRAEEPGRRGVPGAVERDLRSPLELTAVFAVASPAVQPAVTVVI